MSDVYVPSLQDYKESKKPKNPLRGRDLKYDFKVLSKKASQYANEVAKFLLFERRVTKKLGTQITIKDILHSKEVFNFYFEVLLEDQRTGLGWSALLLKTKAINDFLKFLQCKIGTSIQRKNLVEDYINNIRVLMNYVRK